MNAWDRFWGWVIIAAFCLIPAGVVWWLGPQWALTPDQTALVLLVVGYLVAAYLERQVNSLHSEVGRLKREVSELQAAAEAHRSALFKLTSQVVELQFHRKAAARQV